MSLMKSLDRNSLDEQTRLVSRYVAGDLSRSERAEFEAWLVASPELAAEVEMERRLRRGIASAARRGWLKRGATVPPVRDRRWQYAAAASVLMAVGIMATVVVPGRNPEQSAGTGLPLVSSHKSEITSRIVRLSNVRGVAGGPDVSVVITDAPGELVIEPDVVVLTCENGAVEIECAGGSAPQTPQYSEYEMDLVKRHGDTLAWRSSRKVPVARTQLSFTLRDPGSLDAGDYDLIVRGHSPDHQEVVARFWLRVSAQ
jgi:ferric-dicitrate binding protein FerR (iron transport regulator)